MKLAGYFALFAVPAVAVCGTPSVVLPLASARAVPAERVTWVEPANATAAVLVKREGGASATASVQRVLIDGREAATIEEKEFVWFAAAPGHHVICIRDARTGAQATEGVDVGAYGNYYFRISQTADGTLRFQRLSGADD